MEDGRSLGSAQGRWVSVVQLCKGQSQETEFCLKESAKHKGVQALPCIRGTGSNIPRTHGREERNHALPSTWSGQEVI